MSDGLGMIIEILVAILLVLTICYCMLLNRRLKLLRADEDALRATIGELITATEIAERAIAGLKVAARDCEAGLGERLARAERVSGELDRKLAVCRETMGQVGHASQIGSLGAPGEEENRPTQDAQAIAAAAQAFAERLRNRAIGIAA